MTCIVGIQHKGHVWLGGDSAGTAGNFSQKILGDNKVFKNGEFGFGVCGLPKVMDVLAHTIKFPKQNKGTDRQFIATKVIPFIREEFQKADCIVMEGGQKCFDGAIMFGYKGKLYQLQNNFQVVTTAYGFDAVGSGQDIALGSLHATKKVRSPKKRILSALEASAINNAAVRPPFTVIKL